MVGGGPRTGGGIPLDETVKQLVLLGQKLSGEICIAKIERQLQSDDIDDRLDSALFTMSHLFFSGAVAEEVIAQSLRSNSFPDSIKAYPELTCIDEIATLEAWKGSSFGRERNLIGAMSFLVVLMFLFEGFVKLVAERTGEGKLLENASDVKDWVGRNVKKILPPGHLKGINFLNEYRNAWHAFGRYGRGKSEKKKFVRWDNLTLESGKRIPVPNAQQRLRLLAIIVETVIEVNKMRRVSIES